MDSGTTPVKNTSLGELHQLIRDLEGSRVVLPSEAATPDVYDGRASVFVSHSATKALCWLLLQYLGATIEDGKVVFSPYR